MAEHSEMRFNPFPGLRPFEPEEDHLFFGRERETDELLRRLRQNRFVSVLGTSGSGKSSLVRSGLIPSLHSGYMVAAGSAWRVAILRPGNDPIGNLAAALNEPGVLDGDEAMADTNQVLLETTLRRSDLGLADCVKHARLPEHENLVVVVDQFEELFRFKESRKAHGSRDEAIAFAKLLLGAANQHKLPVYIVITMRSDFIGDCMEYPGLPEAINEGQYLIPRMTREELRQAIQGPVAVGGGQIAPRLVARLLNEVGDDPDQLPVLQHALMRSWDWWSNHHGDDEALDLEHYEAIGTMTEALSRHAEEAYAELRDPARQEVAERLFKALTDKRMDDRGVRRPTPVRNAAAIADVDEHDVISVVDVFRRPGRSFLMPPSTVVLDGDSILDLSHESLMRNWARLVEWVDEETTSGKAYRRVCRAARRFEEGAGSLWVDPELALGRLWRDDNKPTEMWARRYDPDFTRAMNFLDQSHEAQEAARRAEEAERAAKLRRARIVAGVLGTAAVITLIFGLLALRAGRIARQAELMAQEEAQTSAAVTDFLVGLFEVVDPETAQGNSISAREILDQGAVRIDAELAEEPEVAARMKRTVGKVYGSLGLYEEAEPLLVNALETLEAELGPDDPQTLEARQRLAEVAHERGRFGEAVDSFRSVLASRQKILGPEDPATLESQFSLAKSLFELGQYDEAREGALLAASAQSRILGDDHEQTLESRYLLGEIADDLGQFPEAEKIFDEVWAAQKRVLGDEHPDAIATMGSLGSLYSELGRYDEANRLYQQNLESRQRVFGDEHPKTLQALSRMAQLREDQGFWGEAEPIYEQVLTTRRRVLGEEHPSTLNSEMRLAWLLRSLDRLEEAEALSRHAFEVGKRVLGEEARDTRRYANVLAATLSAQGRNASAEAIYIENLEIYTRLYGVSHPNTCVARNNLGVCYGDWGRIDENERLFRENYEIEEAARGTDNPQTLFGRNNLIAVLNDQGKQAEAESLAVDGLERHERILGKNNPQTLTAMRQLLTTLGSQNRTEEAESLGSEWIERHRQVFGDEHPETLDAIDHFAWTLQNQGREEEALALREQVLEGRREVFGEDHRKTVWAFGNLAWLCQTMGDTGRALELRTAALAARRRMAEKPDAGPHDKYGYADALVDAQRELQNPPEAVRFAELACEMTDYANRNYVATLANAYFLDGRTQDAIAAQEKAIALVSEEDPGARNWMEQRLAQFHEAMGNLEPKREMQIAELDRKREAAEAEDASPRAKNAYAWELLIAAPTDLRDPEEALRVSLAANEQTNFEQAGQLSTLALAYHQTGNREKAVETQEKVVEIADDVWAKTNHPGRLRVFRGDGSDEVDIASILPGRWSGQVGPVAAQFDLQRDGDYINAVSMVELPWVPRGELVARWHIPSRKFELQRSDSGFTNLRWEPGHFRVTDDGNLLFWHYKQWFVASYTKDESP